MTGHRVPEGHELSTPETGSFVRVVGWREVASRTGGAYLAYTILAAAPSANIQPCADGMPPPTSEARLVMRRYRDFVKLHATLTPYARQAGLTLPPLPSRLTALGRKLSPEVGAQRQRALHDWLSRVACHPCLLCDELRVFLGLPPKSLRTKESKPPPCQENMNIDKMDVEPLAKFDSEESQTDGPPEEAVFAVDLSELEAKAVECMLDDQLWGR